VKILFSGSEMTPFAKTGGLGDVLGALPLELAGRGHEVFCCLPFYRSAQEVARNAKPAGVNFSVAVGPRLHAAEIFELQLAERLTVLFVRHDEFFDRSELYHTGARDYEDNAERFLFFSKAVVELLGYERFRPDVMHCHDWQTAFVPVEALFRRQTRGAAFNVKTVFTIHNLAYQGVFPATDFPLTNLPGEFFTIDGLEFYGQMNLMKGGLVFSDAITTVSPTYVREIQTPGGGHGLDAVLRQRHDDIYGVLNGADYRFWNPATDSLLKKNYGVGDLAGKRVCRAELLRRFDLSIEETMPVAAFISRLTDQKGVDLLADAMDELTDLGLAMIVLGKGERQFETRLLELAAKHPRRVAVRIAHDEELSHQIQGGADILLMPSKFEPCGLTQMYALKYGTIPVVHATGGLNDTVSPYDPKSGMGNGFRFTGLTVPAFVGAVQQAVRVYQEPKQWKRLVENAMASDFSWQAAAIKYEKLYAVL